MTVNVKVCYYRQYDADLDLEIPAEAYAGWSKEELPFDLSRTALVVMHAMDCGTAADYPGWYRAVEYLPRANEIAREVFPSLLREVRAAGMTVYHVPMEESLALGSAGYNRARRMTASASAETEVKLPVQPWVNRLLEFKRKNVSPGIGNIDDIARGYPGMKFYESARPMANEDIVINGEQLFELCREDGIDHLIYIGFAINWCLLMSPGGMFEMSRRGLLCSTISEAVTAVERKETARYSLEKESALWRISLAFGFVFELEDLIEAIRQFDRREDLEP